MFNPPSQYYIFIAIYTYIIWYVYIYIDTGRKGQTWLKPPIMPIFFLCLMNRTIDKAHNDESVYELVGCTVAVLCHTRTHIIQEPKLSVHGD